MTQVLPRTGATKRNNFGQRPRPNKFSYFQVFLFRQVLKFKLYLLNGINLTYGAIFGVKTQKQY